MNKHAELLRGMSAQFDRIDLESRDFKQVLDSCAEHIDQLTTEVSELKEPLEAERRVVAYRGIRIDQLTAEVTQLRGLCFAIGSETTIPYEEIEARLNTVSGSQCPHPVHSNPGLIIPCPECGADGKGQ